MLHQMARKDLLTAHLLELSAAPVAATYALYWGLDSSLTLNALPKYTYKVGAPHTGACT